MEKLPAKLSTTDTIILSQQDVSTIFQLASLCRQFIRQIAVLKVSQIVVKKVGDKTVDLALDIPREIKTVGLPPWGKLR